MANIYLIGVFPDAWTDYGSRIIIADTEAIAIRMWKEKTSIHIKRMGECTVRKIGEGNISEEIVVTTG